MKVASYLSWSVLLRGLAAVAFGAMALAWPGATLLVLLIMFGCYALVDGLCSIVGPFTAKERPDGWWLLPLAGVLSVIVGILAFTRPGLTAMVLLLFIAARAIFVGIMDIAFAIQQRHHFTGMWLLGISGIISILFGMVVFAYPPEAMMAIIWMVGWYAVIIGFFQVFLVLAARIKIAKIEDTHRPAMV